MYNLKLKTHSYSPNDEKSFILVNILSESSELGFCILYNFFKVSTLRDPFK